MKGTDRAWPKAKVKRHMLFAAEHDASAMTTLDVTYVCREKISNVRVEWGRQESPRNVDARLHFDGATDPQNRARAPRIVNTPLRTNCAHEPVDPVAKE
jgi:hypothetical protein